MLFPNISFNPGLFFETQGGLTEARRLCDFSRSEKNNFDGQDSSRVKKKKHGVHIFL